METADRPSCASCTHRHGTGAREFLCGLYPRDEADPITGAMQPPYHWCREVLRVTRANPWATCMHHSSAEPRQMRLVLEEIEETGE